MPVGTETKREDARNPDTCLARSVAAAFVENPALEAVTIDRDRKTISVATLGRTDVPQISERIQKSVEEAQASGHEACSLVAGEGDCSSCLHPLSEEQRNIFTVRHEAGATTIARVTCPTAPKFWRWRSIPWPRVVPREVEFLEHEHDTDEWKPQLAAALLCGVLGLVGFALRGHPYAVAGYILAYLAGSWFTVQEVWERLVERKIDVHFLMLAVAAGSASIGAWGEGAMLLFLFSFSGALEHYALGRTQKEIKSLFREAP